MPNKFRAARHDDGFTLIELLIVIIILGILAAIVIFAVGGLSGQGTAAACKTDGKSVDTAVEAYYVKKTSYPSKISDLKTENILKDLPTTDSTKSYWFPDSIGPGGATAPTVLGYKTGAASPANQCYPPP